MRIHSKNLHIQRLGVITLGYCILTTIDDLTEALDSGMDEVVVAALEEFKEEAEIQRYGRMLLGQKQQVRVKSRRDDDEDGDSRVEEIKR